MILQTNIVKKWTTNTRATREELCKSGDGKIYFRLHIRNENLPHCLILKTWSVKDAFLSGNFFKQNKSAYSGTTKQTKTWQMFFVIVYIILLRPLTMFYVQKLHDSTEFDAIKVEVQSCRKFYEESFLSTFRFPEEKLRFENSIGQLIKIYTEITETSKFYKNGKSMRTHYQIFTNWSEIYQDLIVLKVLHLRQKVERWIEVKSNKFVQWNSEETLFCGPLEQFHIRKPSILHP